MNTQAHQHAQGPGRPSEQLQPPLIQDPWDLPLGAAEQACKECRRRKAKCNRGIPTCGLCLKYNRHCLYEKHSKTPLTRKHLTEVEERLERAEALLRKARLIPPSKADASPTRPGTSSIQAVNDLNHAFDFSNLQDPIPLSPLLAEENAFPGTERLWGLLPSGGVRDNSFPSGLTDFGPPLLPGSSNIVDDDRESSGSLEASPLDDFEWDETDLGVFEATSQTKFSWGSTEAEDEENIIDGMGSLTVDERESGYLGVASGAALLRMMDPSSPRTKPPNRPAWRPLCKSSLILSQPNANRHILDSMIDAYFRLYHLSYPIIHEPTFRAQYSEVIPRPNGDSWLILANVVAAIGVFSTSVSSENMDLMLFGRAKRLLTIQFLESSNLIMVQALLLSGNYIQKRNKPNSGYNYLGIAKQMAVGLGLHKAFPAWNITPLKMEMRRRVWWNLAAFDNGASITFSRPLMWPGEGNEVSLPLNINDEDLTAASTEYPPEREEVALCTPIRVHASFHTATNPIYSRVISKPVPSAASLISMDDTLIGGWLSSIPRYFSEGVTVPSKYRFAHYMMEGRYRNFRIIMYRPFVIRRALILRTGKGVDSPASQQAYDRCLEEARKTIASTEVFWTECGNTRMDAWYALYFVFQAALIPCICLRNSPLSPDSISWRDQISSTLNIIRSLSPYNSSASRFYQVIMGLCGQFLQPDLPLAPDHYIIEAEGGLTPGTIPIDESPETQVDNMYSMMWPNADINMQDDPWMEFMKGQNDAF